MINNLNNSEQRTPKILTQSDAVLYFLQRLDIEMLNDILDDNRTYQDFIKYLFIQKLNNAIDEFIKNGDTFLQCNKGFCNAEICNYKCTGYSFIGNNSKNYMDLIIDIKNGKVHDMYECSMFKNYDKDVSKNTRIRIDNF